MNDGDWLFIATLMGCFLVQLQVSPPTTEQSADGALGLRSVAMGGHVIHEVTIFLSPRLCEASWWPAENAQRSRSTVGAYGAAKCDAISAVGFAQEAHTRAR